MKTEEFDAHSVTMAHRMLERNVSWIILMLKGYHTVDTFRIPAHCFPCLYFFNVLSVEARYEDLGISILAYSYPRKA